MKKNNTLAPKICSILFLISSLVCLAATFFDIYQNSISKNILEAEIVGIPERRPSTRTFHIKTRFVNEDGVELFFWVRIDELFSKKFKKQIGDKISIKTNDDFTIVLINDPKYGYPANLIITILFTIISFITALGIWYQYLSSNAINKIS